MSDILSKTTLDCGILKLTLNRPEALNSLSAELMHELEKTFASAKEDSKVKAILITGEGKAFCAGADINKLKALSAIEGVEFARLGQKVFTLLETLGKPSIAAVNGYALGGGCELAMSATMRIAADKAIFGQPEVKLGVIPGFGGTQRLARLVGKGRALDLCLTARNIEAKTAEQWGLVSRVVSNEDLEAAAVETLKAILATGPIASQSVISAINSGYDLSLSEAFEFEALQFGLCCATKDKHEGVSAFLEKRTADFIGE